MRLKPLFLSVFFGTFFCSTAALAEECSDWLVPDFWKSASAEAVKSCLGAGRTLTERTELGETPLHLAAADSGSAAVLSLLRYDADVSLTTAEGLTPLHVAARDTKHSAVISYLLVWGSDVEKRITSDACFGPRTCADNALHLAADRPSAAPILAALLAGGADPGHVDGEKREPLQRAVLNAGFAEIDILLKAGANIDKADIGGGTALHLLAKRETSELLVAQRLINAGADVDARRDDDVTPLISVAYYTTNPEVFALLLSHSEDPCHESKTGITALTGHDFNEALTKDKAYWSLHEQCSQD